jgi:hypothetical protein
MKPKILVLDIETAPALAYIWSLYDNGPIPLDRLKSPSRILCWAAKYVGERTEHQGDERGGRKAMLATLRDLLADAEAVVTYNGSRFDLPRINGELVANRLKPVPKPTHIDLYQTVKGLGMMSGKLQYVAEYLDIGAKLKHAGFSMWRAICERNDVKAWDRMLRYNMQDVRLTERLYKRLAPYIHNHPRLRPSGSRPTCEACGSTRLQSRGYRYTRMYKIHRYQCQSCGHWPEGKREKVK